MQWLDDLKTRYGAGIAHGFILSGNIRDAAAPGISITQQLTNTLVKHFDLVVFYSRSTGITFPNPQHKQRFETMTASNSTEQPDPLLAALQGTTAGELPRQPAPALQMIDRVLRQRAALVIDQAELIFSEAQLGTMQDSDKTLLSLVTGWGRDDQISAAGSLVILLCDDPTLIHSSLRLSANRWESLTVTPPDHARRQGFITEFLRRLPQENQTNMQIDAPTLARLTAGLTLSNVADVLLRGIHTGAVTAAHAQERKAQIMQAEYQEVISPINPRFGFDAIGGLQHVKDFFTRSVINPMRDGNVQRVPMGVLLTGPAGTGKSAVAEAVAFEAGINAVRLDLSKIFGRFVGDSERNLERALGAVASLTPALIFIDEIDQSVQRNNGGGDSGVSSRVFKRLLEFMSDPGNRGKVIFLAATNRPDLLDPALKRPGRFDKKIPFLIPNATEREDIFHVMARRYSLELATVPPLAIVITEGWTGAEIEAATVKALELTIDEELAPADAIAAAVTRIKPSTQAIAEMTRLAIAETNDTDLLPPAYREMAASQPAPASPQTPAKRTLN